MYTLGGGISEERGWGREDETFTVKEELAAYGVRADLVRSRRPRHRDAPRAHPDARRGLPALRGHRRAVRALGAGGHAAADERRPARDPRGRRRRRARHAARDPLPGVVDPAPGGAARARVRARRRRRREARARCARGDRATPTSCCCPRRTPWSRSARSCRSPGVRDALAATAAPVVGVSPIVGGAPVRGMADACLAAIGVETSAVAVAAALRRRASAGGLLDGWLVARRHATRRRSTSSRRRASRRARCRCS